MSLYLPATQRRRWLARKDPGLAFLFADGEAGAWYDPSDATTVFQERTGASATTPAGAGDPVGTILDKSGNANHATASSDAARPTRQQDANGNWYLEYDNTDDVLVISSGAHFFSGTVAHSVFYAITALEAGGTGQRVLDIAPNSVLGDSRLFTWEIALRVNGGFVIYDSAVVLNATSVVSHICPANANVTDDRAWKDGTELGVSSSTAQAMDTGNGANLGRGGANFRLYGAAFVAAEKLSDRARAESFLAGKSGVTLA